MPWLTGTLHILGAPPPRTYYPGAPPFRFSSSGAGVARATGDETFARILPRIAANQNGTPQTAATLGAGNAVFPSAQRIWFNIFYGRKLSVENTLT